jgi:3' terminal RNA ribose 2'-O-methyltransferase Hen1
MLLTITATYKPATDIGFLLHKHPNNLHEFPLSFGKAYVFYPEVHEERCTVALLLDVDPIGLVRKSKNNESFALKQYVNDRPYVASSFMSVALNRAFGSLLSGKNQQELVETSLPLEAKISVLPCRGDKNLLEKLFGPLGYGIEIQQHILDEKFQAWGNSEYYTVILKHNCSIRALLTHLYVLIPVLDYEKHYYIDKAEIEKLLRYGDGWLESHPEKELIIRRYLKFKDVTNEALERLIIADDLKIETDDDSKGIIENQIEIKTNLNEQRLTKVAAILKKHSAKSIIDLGCGEGKLLEILLRDPAFEKIVGCDVSFHALTRARNRLRLERLSLHEQRIKLIQIALTYSDKRLAGYDAATLIEVIEHLDLHRLDAFKRVVFEFARPRIVIITTPNAEYNILFDNLPAKQYRHPDHRFEWTRKEFENWAYHVANEFGYQVYFESIGQVDDKYGAPTQMGVFLRNE